MRKALGTGSIHDVAKATGVSLSTVSRVFNQPDTVKAETREKVINAAQLLGYIPNMHTLRETLAINIPAISNPFYSDILNGAKASANQHQYDMFITQEILTEDNVLSYMSALKRSNIRGLITLNSYSHKILSIMRKRIPLVQCCEYEDEDNISCVGIDDLESTEKGMQHILATNHKRVALINGPETYKYSRLRYVGYCNALQNANISINREWIVHLPEISAEIAFASAVKLLSSANIPNAFFVVSDLCAAAVIRAAKYKGFRVPDDIVVIGFDNVEISSFTVPSITTISQPRFQLGYIACDLLCSKIENPKTDVQKVLLDTELIIRESTMTTLSL